MAVNPAITAMVNQALMATANQATLTNSMITRTENLTMNPTVMANKRVNQVMLMNLSSLVSMTKRLMQGGLVSVMKRLIPNLSVSMMASTWMRIMTTAADMVTPVPLASKFSKLISPHLVAVSLVRDATAVISALAADTVRHR